MKIIESKYIYGSVVYKNKLKENKNIIRLWIWCMRVTYHSHPAGCAALPMINENYMQKVCESDVTLFFWLPHGGVAMCHYALLPSCRPIDHPYINSGMNSAQKAYRDAQKTQIFFRNPTVINRKSSTNQTDEILYRSNSSISHCETTTGVCRAVTRDHKRKNFAKVNRFQRSLSHYGVFTGDLIPAGQQ